MTKAKLAKRIKSLKSWDDACSLANELYPTKGNCGGTLAECFISGWTNAADMIDDGQLRSDDWESVRYYVTFETNNMHLVA